jgi:hypothetical protein
MSPEPIPGPCVDPVKFARVKEVLPTRLVQELLGCTWGHTIGLPEDRDPCQEPAAQIVALHPQGGPDAVHVKLCAYHVRRVTALTTSHKEST